MMGTMGFNLPTAWKADCANAATSSSRSMLPLGFWAAYKTSCLASTMLVQYSKWLI